MDQSTSVVVGTKERYELYPSLSPPRPAKTQLPYIQHSIELTWLVFPWCLFGWFGFFFLWLVWGTFLRGRERWVLVACFLLIVLFILARHEWVLCVGIELILRWKPLNNRGGCKGAGAPLPAPSGGPRCPAFPALEHGGCSLCPRHRQQPAHGKTLKADLLLPSVVAYDQMTARRRN